MLHMNCMEVCMDIFFFFFFEEKGTQSLLKYEY